MPPKMLDWPTGFANVSDTNKRIDFLRRITGLQVFFLFLRLEGFSKSLVYCDEIFFEQ